MCICMCICVYIYIYIYCIYIYIYTHTYIQDAPGAGTSFISSASGILTAPSLPGRERGISWGSFWLRTDGVNTNGAAAKVIDFDRLGKKVRPGTFGKIKVG